MKKVRLKNISGALLTVTPGKGRGLHFTAGESKPVPAATLESKDIARLIKKGFLAVVEDQPGDKTGKRKGKWLEVK